MEHDVPDSCEVARKGVETKLDEVWSLEDAGFCEILSFNFLRCQIGIGV